MIYWFDTKPFAIGGNYILRHTTNEVKSMVKEVVYKVEIHTLHKNEDEKEINTNNISGVRMRTTISLFFDSHKKNRITGSVFLIDEATDNTVAAGMIN